MLHRLLDWLRSWWAPLPDVLPPEPEPPLPPSFMALLTGPYGQAMYRAVAKAKQDHPTGKHSRALRQKEALEWFGHYLMESQGTPASSVQVSTQHLLLEWWVAVLDERIAYVAPSVNEPPQSPGSE